MLEYYNLLRQKNQGMVQISNQNCHIPSKVMVSRQSQILLLSLAVLLVIHSVGAFQSSFRAPWQSSLLGKEIGSTSLMKDGHKLSSAGCASARAYAKQSENEDEDETSFLMKPFATPSGEIVYVLRLLSPTSSHHRLFPFRMLYIH